MFGVPPWDEYEEPQPDHCYYQAHRGCIEALYVKAATPAFLEYGIQFDGDPEDDIHWYTFSGSYEVAWE